MSGNQTMSRGGESEYELCRDVESERLQRMGQPGNERCHRIQYPGRLDKVTGAENGKFKKLEEATVRLRNEYANTIPARYWKGIAGNGDNLVVEREETK